MEYMDMHSHILPGLDDGSKNMDMTLAMLRVAEEEGIRTIYTTPHCMPGKGHPTLAKVEELEETNYNMIDNVLNNEKPKKEEERSLGRISIEEKLAEKKAIIVQRKTIDYRWKRMQKRNHSGKYINKISEYDR